MKILLVPGLNFGDLFPHGKNLEESNGATEEVEILHKPFSHNVMLDLSRPTIVGMRYLLTQNLFLFIRERGAQGPGATHHLSMCCN